MNAKISAKIEVIIYLLLYNFYDCTFKAHCVDFMVDLTPFYLNKGYLFHNKIYYLDKIYLCFAKIRFSKHTVCRSSRPEVFCKKDVLRKFAKFTGKDTCTRVSFLIKLGA